MLLEPTTNPQLSVRAQALTNPSPNTLPNKNRMHPRKKTLKLEAKRPAHIPRPHHALLPDDIGKYIVCDAEAVIRIGWTQSVRRRCGRGYFAFLLKVKHPARRLLW